MNGVQIRVGDLLYAIGKRWKMILAFVLVGCGFGAALSGISYVQGNYTNYRINCSIAVTSQSETGNFTGNGVLVPAFSLAQCCKKGYNKKVWICSF